VGLGEPLAAPVRRDAMEGPSPVQRAAAPSTSPPAPPADAAPPPAVAGWDAGESPPSDGGEVADDAPLIGGRVAATSLGADAPASPATGAADDGDRADLPLQHPEAAVPLQRSATAAAGPSAAAPVRQVARGAEPHVPDSAPTAPSPGLIGDRAPATRLGGEQDVPAPPVAPHESAAAAAHPRRDPEGELPLQRQAAAATAQAAGGPASAQAPAAGAGAPTTGAATVPAMPDVVTGESTPFAPSPDVSPAPGGAPDTPRPALDENPALVPDGAPTMASAPLLPHRPALLQRTLESHAAASAPAPGSAGSPSQEAARPVPMSATAPTPRSGPSVHGGVGDAGRPARSSVAPPQQVQPLRRVVAGAPASVAPPAPGSVISPASVAPAAHGSTATPPASGPSALMPGPPVDDGFGPMTAITDVGAGPSATAPRTALAELGSVAEAVALHAPAVSWGTSGTAIGTPQAVQTLAAGAPTLAAPSALRPAGGTAASGPSAVQRASAQPQGSAAGQPVAPFTSWPAPADGGGHLDLAVPPVPASFAATAGPVGGSALTTAVQRDLTVHAPAAEPATPPAQVQREEAPPMTAAPAPPTATAVPDPADAPAGRGGPQTEEELDVLAGRLYDHIAGRLRHELRMDRERTGLLNDLH
jgi:hypothetical protein